MPELHNIQGYLLLANRSFAEQAKRPRAQPFVNRPQSHVGLSGGTSFVPDTPTWARCGRALANARAATRGADRAR
jgi:hypothetical protein